MTPPFVGPYVLLEMGDHGHEWAKGELIDVAVFHDTVLDMVTRMDDAHVHPTNTVATTCEHEFRSRAP